MKRHNSFGKGKELNFMTFPLLHALLSSLKLHKKTAVQLVVVITLIWAVLCLPFPFLEERGYSLSTLEARGGGLGTLKIYSAIGIGLILMAIFWHQTVLLDREVLKDRSVRRALSYGLRWVWFLLLMVVGYLGLVYSAVLVMDDARGDIGHFMQSEFFVPALVAIGIFIQFLFFRGWVGLVAIAVDGPKINHWTSWRITRAFRWEILLFAFLLNLLYFGQGQLDTFLLNLNLNGETPEGAGEWGILFFWGVVWSLPAAIVLLLEVAFLTELYSQAKCHISTKEDDLNAAGNERA